MIELLWLFIILIVIAIIWAFVFVFNTFRTAAKTGAAIDQFYEVLNPDSGEVPVLSKPDPGIIIYRKPDDNPRYIRFNIDYPKGYKRVLAGSIAVAGTYYQADKAATWLIQEPIGIELERDTNNKHDKNAIKVWGINISKDGSNTIKYHIGFVPADIAEEIASKKASIKGVPVKVQTNHSHDQIDKIYITILEM